MFKENIVAFSISGKQYAYENIVMKPLCTIENRPVYKGDILYTNYDSYCAEFIVERVDGDKFWSTEDTWIESKYLTWTKPKQKRYGCIVNFKDGSVSDIQDS